MASAIIQRPKFNKQLGQRIREIREQKGISLKMFETKDGAVDRHDLSRIESGQKTPSVYTLYKICQILGIRMQDFFADLY